MKPTFDWSNRRERRAATVFMFALLNFVVFAAVAMSLGGDALSGSHSNGHYFLSNHGHLTEVSAGVFRYSQVHAISVVITHVVGIAAVGHVVGARRRQARELKISDRGGTA